MQQQTIIIREAPKNIENGITFIVGKPGVGKSHFVNELKDAYPDAIVYRFWIGSQDPDVNDRIQFNKFISELGIKVYGSAKRVDIDELIGNKRRILIMTKYDICDKEETNKFIKYYEDLGYVVVPVDLMNGKDTNKIIDKSLEIMKEENQKRLNKGLKPRSLRALIVGVPNAGKSTLINRLIGRKSAGVGNKPGFTKSLSWIRINKDIELLDSPGILWPKIENQENAHVLAAFSSIKEEILDNMDLSCFILKKMMELYPKNLEDRYGITELDEDFIETFDVIGKKRGALTKGGVADYEKVATIIVNDLKNGYLGNVTLDRLEK